MRIQMLDIPEVLIVALAMLLVVLWTRHWLIRNRSGQIKK
jgi:hypothetical protein